MITKRNYDWVFAFVMGCSITAGILSAYFGLERNFIIDHCACYENHATLHSQWLDTSHSLCNGCLLFNVTECEKGNYGVFDRNCKDHWLYFEGEYALRSDLNDSITVRWCYVPAVNDFRVKGVWNA